MREGTDTKETQRYARERKEEVGVLRIGILQPECSEIAVQALYKNVRAPVRAGFSMNSASSQMLYREQRGSRESAAPRLQRERG